MSMKYLRLGLEGGIQVLAANHKLSRFLKDKKKYPLEVREAYLKNLLRKLAKGALRADLLVKGQENVPEGQVVYYGNHTSNYDPLAMLTVSDRLVTFLAKKEIRKFFIIGRAQECMEGAFLDREDLRSELTVFKKIVDQLKENPELSYIIFPEGTRSRGPDYALGTFKPGAFQIATRASLPIVPFALYLPARVLDPHYHYHRYPIQITYGKPLLPEDYASLTTKDIAEEVKRRVQEMVDEEKKQDFALVMSHNKYSEKKTRKVLLYTKPEKKS